MAANYKTTIKRISFISTELHTLFNIDFPKRGFSKTITTTTTIKINNCH